MTLAFGSKEFIAGMSFNVKTSAYVYETGQSETSLDNYHIDQIWNCVGQTKNPSWPITRAVHIVGAGVFGFFPVARDDDGREHFTFTVNGQSVTVYAPDLVIPQGDKI